MDSSFSQTLKIATKVYYWKPMTAFFRSIELGMYFDSIKPFDNQTLDLGCGDGGVIRMLLNIGLVEKLPVGIDISYDELKKAQITKEHLDLLQADANNIPFQDNSFSSIICNGVLCSIPEGVEKALKEVNRVLKDGGIILATVPTDKFIEVLILPKILKKLSKQLNSIYIKRLNNRLPHFNTFSYDEWIKKFEQGKLSVIHSKQFFSEREGFIWNILSFQLFRIIGLLKKVKNKKIKQLATKILEKIFECFYNESHRGGPLFGYIFIIAKKN